MAKRIFFYIVLVLLPFLGYAIDWQMQNFKNGYLIESFSLWPRIIFVMLGDIVFAAIIFWLARQTTKNKMPIVAAIIFAVMGLAVVCIPTLFRTQLSASAQFFTSWLPAHRSIAGAFLFTAGLAALVWRPEPETAS